MIKNKIANKLEEIINNDSFTESEISYFLNLIRKYMEYIKYENKSILDKYTLLKFFCDWSCHFEISQSVSGLEIIEKINSIIAKDKDNADNGVMIKNIVNAISFLSFREQIKLFLLELNLKAEWIENDEKWKNFLRIYIEIIINCPLIFEGESNKKVKLILDNIIANPIQVNIWVIGFYITRFEKDVFNGIKVANSSSFLAIIIYTNDVNMQKIIIPLTPEEKTGWILRDQTVVAFIE